MFWQICLCVYISLTTYQLGVPGQVNCVFVVENMKDVKKKSLNAKNSGKYSFTFPIFILQESKPEQFLYLLCLSPLPKTSF